jgi:hypothetical protein
MAYLFFVYADAIFPRTIIEWHDPLTGRIVYQHEIWDRYIIEEDDDTRVQD